MTPLIDAHEFTDLLLPPKESVAKKTSASRAVVTVAAMIREKKPGASARFNCPKKIPVNPHQFYSLIGKL